MDVPSVVRNKALAHDADEWLRDLPELVATVADEWGLTLGAPYTDPTEAYVVAVTQADGSPAVLKLIVPRDGDAARNEITALRLADGHGCAQLLRADETRHALLLERLGPSLSTLDRPIGERHTILCSVAQRFWRGAADSGLPTGADKGRWLRDHIVEWWEQLDRPCSERVVDHAVACADHRIDAHDDERAVLVHGDVHQWNTLRSLEGDDWKLVDPDGLLAEPAYDLGIIMREDPVELMTPDPMERARRLGWLSGLDVTAIWEWGVVERVSTGLLCVQIGLQPWGDQMLAAAEHLAASDR